MIEGDIYEDERLAYEEDKRHVRLGRDRRKDGLAKFVQDKDTRNWLWDLLCECGIYQGMPSLDPVDMGYRSGRRDIGLLILHDVIHADPTAYVKMMKENSENE